MLSISVIDQSYNDLMEVLEDADLDREGVAAVIKNIEKIYNHFSE